MRYFPQRCFALVPAALLLATALRAQDKSHEIDPEFTSPKNISKLLDPKKLKGKGANVDVEMVQRLLRFFGDRIDPNMIDPEMVKQFLRDNPEFKDPENLKRLRDLADKQIEKREPRNPNDPNPPVNWGGVRDQLKKIDDVRQKQPIDPRDPKDPIGRIDRPPIDKKDFTRPSDNPPRPKKENKDFRDLAKLLKLGNSPEAKNMERDFARIMGGDNKGGGGFLKDLEKEWKRLGGSGGKNDGGNSGLKDLANRLKVPDSSSGSGGSGRTGSTNSSSSGGSSGGSFSAPPSSGGGGGWNFGGGGGGGSWTPVLLLLLIAGGGVLFYLYYVRHRKPAEEAPVEQSRAWPVNPLQVNSREDVVKAFEFLSVSKCGDEAVNWHHLQIADQMGNREPANKEAADRLARLYEKARYAPANELFDDMDIAEARARFIQLAGVPTA